MLWIHPGETMMYVGIGILIGGLVVGLVVDRQQQATTVGD